jgi:hypothetical protein
VQEQPGFKWLDDILYDMKCGLYEMRSDHIRKEKQPYCRVTKSYYGGCEGRLEECSLSTWTKTKEYVAHNFVADLIEELGNVKITPKEKGIVMRAIKESLNNGIPINRKEIKDMDGISYELIRRLYDSEIGYLDAFKSLTRIETVFERWVDVFARFKDGSCKRAKCKDR